MTTIPGLSLQAEPSENDNFDPYHKWLGIRDHSRSYDHYLLLGISQFEQDPDVIQSAVDAKMAFVRTKQNGHFSQQAEKILSELSLAASCLLNEKEKQAYDVKLHSKLTVETEQQSTRKQVEEVKPSSFDPLDVEISQKAKPVPLPHIETSRDLGEPKKKTISTRALVGGTIAASSAVVATAIAGFFTGKNKTPNVVRPSAPQTTQIADVDIQQTSHGKPVPAIKKSLLPAKKTFTPTKNTSVVERSQAPSVARQEEEFQSAVVPDAPEESFEVETEVDPEQIVAKPENDTVVTVSSPFTARKTIEPAKGAIEKVRAAIQSAMPHGQETGEAFLQKVSRDTDEPLINRVAARDMLLEMQMNHITSMKMPLGRDRAKRAKERLAAMQRVMEVMENVVEYRAFDKTVRAGARDITYANQLSNKLASFLRVSDISDLDKEKAKEFYTEFYGLQKTHELAQAAQQSGNEDSAALYEGIYAFIDGDWDTAWQYLSKSKANDALRSGAVLELKNDSKDFETTEKLINGWLYMARTKNVIVELFDESRFNGNALSSAFENRAKILARELAKAALARKENMGVAQWGKVKQSIEKFGLGTVEEVAKGIDEEKNESISEKGSVDEALLERIQAAINNKNIRSTSLVGGQGGNRFIDMPKEGGMLIGFNVTLGFFGSTRTIKSIQPIFLTAEGKKTGAIHGIRNENTIQIVADPGYVVIGARLSGEERTNGFSLICYKFEKNHRFNPKNVIHSKWIGGISSKGVTTVGATSPVIGLVGSSGHDLDSLGLVFESEQDR